MTPNSPTPDAAEERAEKVRRFRELYLQGKLDEELFVGDLNWDDLAEAILRESPPQRSVTQRDD